MTLTERVAKAIDRADFLDPYSNLARAEASIRVVLEDMKAMNGVKGWLRPCHMIQEYERLLARMSIVVDNSPGE